MRSRKKWLVSVGVATMILISSVVILGIWGRRDRSNYTINDSITMHVIERFDSLGNKNQEEFIFGGGTRGKAVGQLGISNVIYLGITESRGEVLGVHLLHGRENDEIRFSLGQQNPFETLELSASLAENTDLHRSFKAMMDRLARTDKNAHWWIAHTIDPKNR
jgi:hypothetical protein